MSSEPVLPEELILGSMELAEDQAECPVSAPQDRQRLLPPFFASLIVHGLAALTLVSFNFQPRTQIVSPEPGVIQLRIRIPSPRADNLLAEAPASAMEMEAQTEATAQPSISAPESAPRETLVDLPSVDLSPAPSPAETSPERPGLRLLSPLDLRQTIDAIADHRSASNALINCTPVQRESEFVDCGDEEHGSDFSLLERNATYEFFTTVETPQQSRTQRTIGFMVSRTDEIEQQLLASGVVDVAVEHFLRELRATAADISATGNVQLEKLKDQIYSNDSTYQQMKRVMNPR
ncbi:MAG: hypothetical protein Q8L60_14540 [Gammaproteobacteria bacterium]|nr:hypothetical protein [Gammaproteobacteria bacterium]MDP2139617.1 hypothetical protein [Gammaproteobacteria bacterium]MDP2346590.1 hypothetical protein [Gammaproteobacteria bacterium]